MKIPKKIKVCGYDIDVIFEKMQNPTDYGMYVHQDCKIYLNKDDTNKQVIEETFVHEIIHAIDRALGMIIDDERKITSISRVLYQTLNDNNLLK